jgi:hypothetical protein
MAEPDGALKEPADNVEQVKITTILFKAHEKKRKSRQAALQQQSCSIDVPQVQPACQCFLIVMP